jgi:hypothetical protein
MLKKFQWRRVADDIVSEVAPSVATTNPDLRIRNLLDDPRLRAALGLPAWVGPTVSALPARVPGRALSSALLQGVQERAAA